MKKDKKQKYIKPSLTSRIIKSNFFYSNRFSDGEDLLSGLVDVRILAQSACGCCFSQDTNVLLGDHTSKKEIKNIEQGDSVASYNVSKNIHTKSKVLEKIIHLDAQIQYFILNKKIKTTSEHPFWVNGQGWVRAKEIKIGDWLLTSSGEKITVSDIDSYSTIETVYNLELEGDDHNYFADNILVHNQR